MNLSKYLDVLNMQIPDQANENFSDSLDSDKDKRGGMIITTLD